MATQSPAPDGAALLFDYIDKPALASELHCTTRTIDRLTLHGKLPFVQVGNKRLYRRAAVLDWLKSCETPVRGQSKNGRGAR